MREKYKSNTFRYGNNPDHDQAVKNVIHFLEANAKGHWFYWKEWVERFTTDFNKKNQLRSDYDHAYDLAVRSLDRSVIPFLFIEVDGEKHSKKGQQINDGLAEKYITEVLKQDIIRLDKVECLGKESDRMQYFRKALRKYIR